MTAPVHPGGDGWVTFDDAIAATIGQFPNDRLVGYGETKAGHGWVRVVVRITDDGRVLSLRRTKPTGVGGYDLEWVETNQIHTPTPQAPTVDSVPVPRADGAGLIAAERQRQIDAEGWTLEHDDTHTIGELVDAAVCYLRHGLDAEMPVVWPWPWAEDWWKPSDDPIKNLVRAGALISAEIDRLTRAAAGVSSDR